MNTSLEQYLMEERQRRFEDELRKQMLLKEARAAGASQPGMLRRGAHYLGVGLVNVGERLQIQCREVINGSVDVPSQLNRPV